MNPPVLIETGPHKGKCPCHKHHLTSEHYTHAKFAARRLAAAVGHKVFAEHVRYVAPDKGSLSVSLVDGQCFLLVGGNAAYCGDGRGKGIWMRNGKRWDIAPGEKIRLL